MKKYGKQLMNELPDETTRVLTSLCTDWIPEGSEPSENPGGVCGVCRGGGGECECVSTLVYLDAL